MSKKAVQHAKPVTCPSEYETLGEMIVYIAEKYPQKGITYINSRGDEEFVSYLELIEGARKYLHSLYKLGVKRGDVVILEIEQARDFYNAFWASIFGGIIAAPVSSPSSWEPGSAGLHKLTRVWEVLDKPLIVIEEKMRHRYQGLKDSSHFENLRFITTTELESEQMEEIQRTEPDELVFLQFSSGSTGIPKGVKLTNRNIIVNMLALAHGLGTTEDDIAFTWLPHTHDMGIFAQHLTPIIGGCSIVKFSPSTFVRSPYLFLKKISDHRGTWFCCPNFGFEWMVKKVPDSKLDTLDLSCLRLSLNGAEPISTSVMKRFIDKFSACGFKNTMMFPAYGMAEATVAVSLSEIGALPRVERISRTKMAEESLASPCEEGNERDIVEFVHEGYAVEDMSIRIADEEGNTLDENVIGEIQIKGPSVTSGYYNNPEANAKSFIDGWFRTGDLGFMNDGSLVVSGRMKDILFIRGQNYFAHDLEEILYGLGTILRGNLALVGHFNSVSQQEELLAFIKHKGGVEKFMPLRQTIINRLREALGIEVTHVIPVNFIPKTTSGKIQRFNMAGAYQKGDYDQLLDEIRQAEESGAGMARVVVPPQSELEIFLHKSWSRILNIGADKISIDDQFFALGGNSVKAFQLLGEIEGHLNRDVGQGVIISCKTIRETADYLESLPKEQGRVQTKWSKGAPLDIQKAVAITGLSVKLPGASDYREFWDNLTSGKDCIDRISEKRKRLSGYEKWNDWIGELKDIDSFDNEFFEISGEEAIFMDPQQRLILESSYESLEDAGLSPELEEEKNVGVYAGLSANTYYQLLAKYVEAEGTESLHPNAMVGNLRNIVPALLTHTYNFTGPSMAIDTACSSFMVSLHQAVEAIRSESIEGALVTGANILVTPIVHDLSRKAGIMTSEKHARVFDTTADGSVLGEGVVVIYLEPLTRAIKENKDIYAVIRGSAINNDGYSIGIMAPNPKGQHAVLKKAYLDANLSPAEVGYIEAHGSGTTIGDPVELQALNRLYAECDDEELKIGIGSVKSNIGHLLPAAGGAGLVKTMLCLKNRSLVPSLHMDSVNPSLELEKSPFYVVQDNKQWAAEEGVSRKAGISSFGFGGTNAHVILEEWRGEEQLKSDDKEQLLTLSAKSEASLEMLISQTEELLKRDDSIDVASLCYTRNRYRKHYGYRAACLISKGADGATLNSICKGHFSKKRSARVTLLLGECKEESAKALLEGLEKSGVVVSNVYKTAAAEQDELSFKRTDIVLLMGLTGEEAVKYIPEEVRKRVTLVSANFAEGECFEKLYLSLMRELYVAGVNFDWKALHPNGTGRLLHLPPYPFEHSSFWIEQKKGALKS